MGMNTSDIRDMESKQYLFWYIAVPLTVIVLTIAFIYGYKSEEVADVLTRRLEFGVCQRKTTRTGEGRQSLKNPSHQADEADKGSGRLVRYLLRNKKSKGGHQERVDV